MFFKYGKKEIAYLKTRDTILGDAIDKIGHIKRTVDTDLFSSVIHHIIGQQISTAAQKTIWERIKGKFGEITVDAINDASIDGIQAVGMAFRKAEYIKDFANKVKTGKFVLDDIKDKSDSEIIDQLSAIKGIGVWTAEMIMIFCLQRPDILSYNDLAIHRGLRMLYHHRNIGKKKFEKYRLRFSPYATVASLYLWAIAGGAIDGMKDYAPKKTGTKRLTIKNGKP
ncbi:MAG: DNA-3-methyladenine glycosylase 2 family protein [Treponema sp.]|nr:DNA-3-methyladenine glycosylase 2 family protein [Treponema sp.]